MKGKKDNKVDLKVLPTLKKLSDPWISIGTILGQTTIDDYTFHLQIHLK